LVEPGEIGTALAEVLADGAELRARGLARAREFTWERTTREIDAIVQQVAGA
jgi:glycosyltransferase involved in cell wall biosynthesis